MINDFDPRQHPLPHAALLTASTILLSSVFDDLRALGTTVMTRGAVAADVMGAWDRTAVLAEHLPERYVRRYTLAFLETFAVGVTSVMGKLTSSGRERLSCTVEELAMWAIISEAERGVVLGRDGPPDQGGVDDGLSAYRAIKDCPDPFRSVKDLAFESLDVQWLFRDDAVDVGEAPEWPALKPRLCFVNWCSPIDPSWPLHPYLRA